MAVTRRIERPEVITLQTDDVLAQVRAGRIRLPAFQRLLAWDVDDAVRLFDSIYLGYPTGSLVFWETSAPAEKVRFGDWEQAVGADSRAWKIVDGQQRISTVVGYAFDCPPGGARVVFEPLAEIFRVERDPRVGLSVSTLFDTDSLLDWQGSIPPEEPRRRDLIRNTNLAAKRLLEHRFPALVLRASSPEAVLEVFRRVNLMGRALGEADVFFLLTWNPQAASKGVDPLLGAAIERVRQDTHPSREWLADPFRWPELSYLALNHERVRSRVRQAGVAEVLAFNMPKSADASRPAVLLDLEDRVAYQALVDTLAPIIQRDLGAEVFGWRIARKPGPYLYASSRFEWSGYARRGGRLATCHRMMARFDVANFFGSITGAHLEQLLPADRSAPASMWARLCDMVRGWQRIGITGLPQRAFASSVIANAVLCGLDRELRAWAARSSGDFIRWMDDITVFADSMQGLAEAERVVRSALATIGLELNHGKTSYEPATAGKVFPGGLIDYVAGGERPSDEDLSKARMALMASPTTVSRTDLLRLTTTTPPDEVESWTAIVHLIPHVADGLAAMLKRTEHAALAPGWVNCLTEKGTLSAQAAWAKAQLIGIFPTPFHPSWINHWLDRAKDVPTRMSHVEFAAIIPHLISANRVDDLIVLAEDASDPFTRRWAVWGALFAGARDDWASSFFRRHPTLELTRLTWESGNWRSALAESGVDGQ